MSFYDYTYGLCIPPLEYQAKEAHDGWLYSYIYCILAAGNSISSQMVNRYGTEKAGGTAVHYIQNHACRDTLLQPARRAAVLGQPSSLWLHIPLILSSSILYLLLLFSSMKFFVNIFLFVLYNGIISAPKAIFRIRIHLIRIRIQVFD
jgi:hypothetical protein